MHFCANTHHAQYSPRPDVDASHDLYHERLSKCLTCPHRRGHACAAENQLCSILARPAAAHCPVRLWPNDPPLPKPVFRSYAQPPLFAKCKPFQPQKLAIVTSHYNPVGYKKPRAHYDRFAAGIRAAGVPLFTAELAFDDDPFTITGEFGETVLQFRGTRARNQLWQKERLLKNVIRQVPEEFDAIGWFDADVLFMHNDWPEKILKALETCEVLQPFNEIFHLHDNGRMEFIGASLSAQFLNGRLREANGRDGCPGYAWAARAQPHSWLRTNELRDDIIIGCGDVYQACGFTGHKPLPVVELPPAWQASLDAWSRDVYSMVRGNIGVLPLSLLHQFHGHTANRSYIKRWQELIRNQFDPQTDIETDANGLWAWTDSAMKEKPSLMLQLAIQFAGRREDDE